MSSQILAEATRKNQLPGTTPVCNQFKKGGICRRNFCKYRHISKEQEDAEIVEIIQNCNQRKQQIVINNNINDAQLISLGPINGILRRNGVNFEEYQENGLPLVKRRFLSSQEQEILTCDIIETNQAQPIFKGYFAGNCPSPMLRGVDAR